MKNRRLAVILAADVVGYSSMMHEDDAGTLDALRRHRTEVFEPVVAQHSGRLVKLTGDGAITEFPSVLAAIEAAQEIQRKTRLLEGDISLRIGVELGDVIDEADDVYGEGVNMAVRLEGICSPGNVCISTSVRQSLGKRGTDEFVDAGEHMVKGRPGPVEVWMWHSDVAVTERPGNASPDDGQEYFSVHGLPALPSLAIVPFVDMSAEASHEHFADGLSEDIISRLSYLRGVFVASRTSSFVFKNSTKDIRQIGLELGVLHALEGSVRVSGDRLRVVAKLIDCNTGQSLWAKRYDRHLVDLFDVQDEITHAIVTELQIQLSDGETVLDTGGTDNYEAWDLFQQGAISHLKYTDEHHIRARRLFAQALAEDPEFVDAQVFHAWTYWQRCRSGFAKERDAELAECRRLINVIKRRGYETANVVHLDAATHLLERDYDAAVSLAEEARSLGPSKLFGYTPAAVVNIYSGNLETAAEILRETIRAIPSTPSDTVYNLAIVSSLMGNHTRAIMLAEEYLKRVPTDLFAYTTLALAHGLADNQQKARAVIRDFHELYPSYRLSSWALHEPFRDEALLSRCVDTLRRAGLRD